MWSDFGKLRPQKKYMSNGTGYGLHGPDPVVFIDEPSDHGYHNAGGFASGFPEGVQLQEGDARFFEARCRYPAVYIGGNLT